MALNKIIHRTLASTNIGAQLESPGRLVTKENVLTVGECDGFLDKGGIINFVNVGGQVRFQISTVAAAREKLAVSSKLLQLALPLSQNISIVPANAIKLSDGQR